LKIAWHARFPIVAPRHRTLLAVSVLRNRSSYWTGRVSYASFSV
jgi:hypothetical protein